MKVKNIDVNKFKKIKSFALIACLTGTMALTGCGKNLNSDEQIITDNNTIVEEQQEESIYSTEIFHYNTNEIEEYDVISFIYKNEENYNVISAGRVVYPGDKTDNVDMPVSEYRIVSKQCGSFDVSLEEDEKAVISVDYLTKTMSVEEVKIEKSHQNK